LSKTAFLENVLKREIEKIPMEKRGEIMKELVSELKGYKDEPKT
jgi:hypothetical protein